MNCTPTIGIDFKLRTIELDSKKIKLQVCRARGTQTDRQTDTQRGRSDYVRAEFVPLGISDLNQIGPKRILKNVLHKKS